MRRYPGYIAALCALTFAACSDQVESPLSVPALEMYVVEPTDSTGPGSDLEPLSEDTDLTDDQYSQLLSCAKITDWRVRVFPNGSALDHGDVHVWTAANTCLKVFYPRFKQDLLLRVLRDSKQDIEMVPGDWTLGLLGEVIEYHELTGFRCASLNEGSIEAESQHRARWIHRYKGMTGHIDRGPMTDWDAGTCSGTCVDPTLVDEPAYDPYDPGGTYGPCTTEGGGGKGSGTQFEVGDYTGGETVNWQTGIGDGGISACGDAAVMEYVCIDIWTDTGWDQWGCGYITKCGW